ncbi:MAG: HAMP domain-containing histidine kinase [Chloroflexi bacterium]|nr:HAMP domain-containing histidine kinase [Chloroflexota bacterium]
MSIRLRLTLIYSAILGLTLVAFSIVVYVTVSQVNLSVMEDTLETEAKRVLTTRDFRFDHGPFPTSRFAAPETYIQTRRITGEVVDRTPNLGSVVLPLSDTGTATLQSGKSWSEITLIDDQRFLIFNTPIPVPGRIIGVLQVARSLGELDNALDAFRRIIAIGGSLVTLAAFGIGWIMAGLTLRPIHRITQTAQAIGAERDFDRRLQYSGPNDEIGQLAKTFNTMLTELKLAYLQLKQSLQTQRRFIADASHELRTPMTTIRGNVGLLQHEPPISAEDRKAVLTDTVEECDRLIRLVNNLLVLARADAGQPLAIEVVTMKPLIEELCRRARLLNPERTIECEHVVDAAVMGNHDGLKQVMLILLDNALKFTPPEGQIVVSTIVCEKFVSVKVRDTGIGIEPEKLPHIFERFFRGDTARSGSDSGLGLAIAQTLVDSMHGTISVQSAPGKGTEFTVLLPKAAPPPEETPVSVREGQEHPVLA